MGLFSIFKSNDHKSSENKLSKELKTLSRTLAASANKPEVKLSKNVGIAFDSFSERCNMNVLLFGGDMECRACHIEPNIATLDRNFIVADAGGKLYEKYKAQLEAKGYSASYVNLSDPAQSGYNPMAYVFDEKSAHHLAHSIMDNIGEDIAKGSKGIWEAAEANVLFAIIWALSASNEAAVMKDVVDAVEGGTDALDRLFESADAKALNEYNKFKQDISPETRKGVLLSLASRLSVFKAWDEGISSSECEADAKEYIFGRKALFVDVPKTVGKSLSAGTVIKQLAYAITGQMLKIGIFRPQYPLHFLLDDFDKLGRIDGIEELTGNASSQMYAFSIFVPSLDAINKIYADNADSIVQNCDTAVCLTKADDAVAKSIVSGFAEEGQGIPGDAEIEDMAKNLEDNRLLIKVRGFAPVTDERLHTE